MIKKSFLFVLLLFFVGCSTKISIPTLKYGEVHNKQIRNIQIKPFRNDNINQTFYIEKELNKVYLLNTKYFKINPKNPTSILAGDIQTNTKITLFKQTKTNKEICIEKVGKKCKKYFTYTVLCQKRTYTLYTTTNITNINGDLLFCNTFKQQQTIALCPVVKPLLESTKITYITTKEHNNTTTKTKIKNTYILKTQNYLDFPSTNLVFRQLALQNAKQFAQAISPKYTFVEVKLLDEDDQLITKDKIRFETAIKIAQSSPKQAYNLLSSISKKDYIVLYDMGVLQEKLKNNKKALKLYHLSASKQITNSDDMGLILSAIKRVKENESLAKQIQNNK